MSTKDYFGTEILVGDTVTFAKTSGVVGAMEDGIAKDFAWNGKILTKSSIGFYAYKIPHNVINKSRIMPILKDTHPEDYI
jgi:hypothetical protein